MSLSRKYRISSLVSSRQWISKLHSTLEGDTCYKKVKSGQGNWEARGGVEGLAIKIRWSGNGSWKWWHPSRFLKLVRALPCTCLGKQCSRMMEQHHIFHALNAAYLIFLTSRKRFYQFYCRDVETEAQGGSIIYGHKAGKQQSQVSVLGTLSSDPTFLSTLLFSI